jgi:hypothetical protein
MALHYHTEYHLGRRGRVSRSYTGFRAAMAIFADLTFGLCFQLVSLVLLLVFRIMALALQLVVQILVANAKILVIAVSMVVSILTLPFALLHQVVQHAGWEGCGQHEHARARATPKPEWAWSQEV